MDRADIAVSPVHIGVTRSGQYLSADTSSGGLLIALSGLPGVGKTTVSRDLSRALHGVHLRLDTIESSLRASGIIDAAGGWDAAPDAGYQVQYALARYMLRMGQCVIADSVNAISATRDAFSQVAAQTHSRIVNVELVCSDEREHRRRVEARTSDLAGLTVPRWIDVTNRDYHEWTSPVVRVDTVNGSEEAVAAIVAALDTR